MVLPYPFTSLLVPRPVGIVADTHGGALSSVSPASASLPDSPWHGMTALLNSTVSSGSSTGSWDNATAAFASSTSGWSASAPSPSPSPPPPPFIDSFCAPQWNGTWQSITNELGAFTPCFIDVVVLGSACLAMLLLALARMALLYRTPGADACGVRFGAARVAAAALALACAVVPLMQLSARVSLSTFSKEVALPPYEVVSLLLCAAGWGLTATVLFLERKRYVRRGAWLLRFAIIYVVVGQLAKLRFVLILQDHFDTFFVELFFIYTAAQVLLALLTLVYQPVLLPSAAAVEAAAAGRAGPSASSASNTAAAAPALDGEGGGAAAEVNPGQQQQYTALPGGPEEAAAVEEGPICPENRAGLFSALTFSWMTPLMSLGYKQPLNDADVWQLDMQDRSATIHARFNQLWQDERRQRKPWLLRSIHSCFGRRFWWGGLWKLGNDASQFVGPVMLNLLLKSMQSEEPAWHGYVYAGVILLGQVGGVISEGVYFQNVMRVGFHIRQALVAAVYSKALRLSNAGRQGFSSGRITNMMTNDAESLQLICQQLHNLWSAPLRIAVCIVLLFRELGPASLLGFLVLVLTIPVQAFIVNIVQKQVRSALQKGDKRIELMNEMLSAMDIVKCYVWEDSFKSKVLRIRGEEMGQISRAQYTMAVNFFLLNVVPVLVTVVAFGMYTLLGNELTPAKAFTSISLFAMLRFPLFMFPQLITQVVNVNVSLGRLQEMLLADELDIDTPRPVPNPEQPAVEVANATFAWSSPPPPPPSSADASGAAAAAAAAQGKGGEQGLSDVSLSIEAGKLVAIVGGTGQGKSSLVSALLGEMPILPGSTPPVVRGKVAYVPQVAWIFNATVRDNILFGLPYDAARYFHAVRVSALERDFELLPGGDLTEIGERGVNLSGGQKQRVSIARAVYSDADVFFFDDPLSALDAHVAKQVFDTCVRGALAGKTRVMVTNQLHFLPGVDWVVLMEGGRIVEQGEYEQLVASGPKFKLLLEQAGTLEDHSSAGDGDGDGAADAEGAAATGGDGEGKGGVAKGETKGSVESAEGKGKGKAGGAGKTGTKLVQAEDRETGVVSSAVIWRYVKAMGGMPALVVLMGMYLAIEVSRLGSSTWISVWTGQGQDAVVNARFYLSVYSAICLLQVTLTFSNQFWLVMCSQKAARRLHEAMLTAILRAPMAFFHTNPLGRLVNRFTKDTTDIDRNLAQYTSLCLGALFQLVSTFAVIGFLNTIALWALVPLLMGFYIVYLYFQNTAREVKRLDSITRSPVYAQFAEALNGLVTIRAYRAQQRMAAINGRSMDRNTRFTLVNMSANRWLAIRLESLGGLMIFATAVFAVLDVQRATDQAALAPVMGLILSYALTITAMMTMVLRLASVAENSFNAVERVGVYADVKSEAPAVIPDHRPPPGWPAEGEVLFENVVMRYRADLPPVLKGLSALIRPKEKVGVVGRTGAGKSSLFNTLFRLVEVESGRITIDAQDLRLFGVADVRRALMIIPQTPVLFTGTLRFNLDPFGEHEDAELWEALQRAHLKDVVQRLPLGLEAVVHEGGDNFSVGQRQLISLARALLRRARILVLDEATAAVDVGTDALIQRTIRDEFHGCTMLIIAHRLNTIVDSDRILVMDAGMAVEYDTPRNLVYNEGGVFAGMVRSTGAANARHLQRVALGEESALDDAEVARAAAAAAGEQRLRKEATKWRWATAAQWAFAMTLTSSQRDLQAVCSEAEAEAAAAAAVAAAAANADEPQQQRGVLEEVRDATLTLQSVLSGQRAHEIQAALEEKHVAEEKWWSALTRVTQGLALMARQVQAQLDVHGSLRNPLDTDGGMWNRLALTGEGEEAGGSLSGQQ